VLRSSRAAGCWLANGSSSGPAIRRARRRSSDEWLELRIKMRLDFERWSDSDCSIGEGIDQPNGGVAEVACVAGGQLGATGQGNPGNQSVTQIDGTSLGFAFSG